MDHLPEQTLSPGATETVCAGWTWTFADNEGQWYALRDVELTPNDDGMLIGRTTGYRALVAISVAPLARALDNPDERVRFVELRARVEKGHRIGVLVNARSNAPADFDRLALSPISQAGEMATYRVPADKVAAGFRGAMGRLKWVGICPSDEPDTEFEIESLRFITQSEHLASVAQGVRRVGLNSVWYDAAVTRTPSIIRTQLTVPAGAKLSLAVGVPQRQSVTFQVTARVDGQLHPLIDYTVNQDDRKHGRKTSDNWKFLTVDMTEWVGQEVELRFNTDSDSTAALAYWGNVRVTGTPKRRRPNVLIYLVDTMRRDRLSTYGYLRETSPNFTKFAAQGALFEDVVAQSTWTKISVTSLFSSLYPSEHGVLEWGQRLSDSVTTTAEQLRQAGYATLGASTNPFVGNDSNLQQGFDVFYEAAGVSAEYWTQPDEAMRDSGTAAVVNRLLAVWLSRMSGSPFFIYAHVTDPHSPYTPNEEHARQWHKRLKAHRARQDRWNEELSPLIPDGFRQRQSLPQESDLAGLGIPRDKYISFYSDMYDAEIRQTDAEFGRMLGLLDELGLARNTIVVLVSDHGEQFFEHGGTGHADNVYAETARVPFLIRWPEGISPGTLVPQVAGLIDVSPTVLDLAGVNVVDGTAGRSLTRWLPRPDGADSTTQTPSPGSAAQLDGVAGHRRQRAIYSEQHPSEAHEPGSLLGRRQFSITTRKWRGIESVVPYGDEPPFALFDRSVDPLDQNDVAEANPTVANTLRTTLREWRRIMGTRRLRLSTEDPTAMPPDQLQHLRDLGYVE